MLEKANGHRMMAVCDVVDESLLEFILKLSRMINTMNTPKTTL